MATIQFGHSSSRLDARDRQLIATVASAYRQNERNILVVGHASARTQQLPNSKHEVANFKVSFARANSVAQALIRAGVASESVTVEAVADVSRFIPKRCPLAKPAIAAQRFTSSARRRKTLAHALL